MTEENLERLQRKRLAMEEERRSKFKDHQNPDAISVKVI